MDDFSSRVTGVIAPAGQTSLHRVHSGRQNPRSNDISGCMRVASEEEGRRTPLGQDDTQSWQPVHRVEKLRRLKEPAGLSGVPRDGACREMSGLSPPSVSLSWAAATEVTAMDESARRNPRRMGDAAFWSVWMSAFWSVWTSAFWFVWTSAFWFVWMSAFWFVWTSAFWFVWMSAFWFVWMSAFWSVWMSALWSV